MKQILILILLLSTVVLTAQNEEKKVIKKEKVVTVKVDGTSDDEKSVTVNVNEDDGVRIVTVKTMEDGKEKVMEWKDKGKIPAEIQKQLKEDNIDIEMLDGGRDVFIGDGHHVDKRIIVIDDDGGETIEMEWDGDGEMPAKMKKMMKDHDIDLHSIKKGAKGKKMKMRMHKMDREHNGPHQLHMKRGKNMWVAKEEMNKTYIGAQIGTADSGTEVLDVMVDSPAHKAGLKRGDIITEINGANTKSVDDMMKLLSLFDVNDTVEVTYKRDGKSKSTKVKLAERPEAHR